MFFPEKVRSDMRRVLEDDKNSMWGRRWVDRRRITDAAGSLLYPKCWMIVSARGGQQKHPDGSTYPRRACSLRRRRQKNSINIKIYMCVCQIRTRCFMRREPLLPYRPADRICDDHYRFLFLYIYVRIVSDFRLNDLIFFPQFFFMCVRARPTKWRLYLVGGRSF